MQLPPQRPWELLLWSAFKQGADRDPAWVQEYCRDSSHASGSQRSYGLAESQGGVVDVVCRLPSHEDAIMGSCLS